MILRVNTTHPQVRHIARISEILNKGGIIVYPTDTAYALGCDIENKKGVDKILAIKKLPKNKLLSVICPDMQAISNYGYLSNTSFKVMRHCLPGAYTFILKATKLVPRVMMTKRKTIGVRMPDNVICMAIVESLGRPLVTASAKLPGEETLTDPEEIERRLGYQLGCVVDGGIILPDPSSVVDLSVEPPEILREGNGDVSFMME